MWPALLAAAVVLVVGLAAGPARASTLRRMRRPIDRQTWQGCGDPPPDARPRPVFACGDLVVDTSTGRARERRVAELAGSQDKAGGWHWAYVLDDGTAAGAATLKRAAGR